MTADQIIAHYGSPTKAREKTGYTLQTFRNWKTKGVPRLAQLAIQTLTKGKLKAENGECK